MGAARCACRSDEPRCRLVQFVIYASWSQAGRRPVRDLGGELQRARATEVWSNFCARRHRADPETGHCLPTPVAGRIAFEMCISRYLRAPRSGAGRDYLSITPVETVAFVARSGAGKHIIQFGSCGSMTRLGGDYP